jgi:hypothetical protein
MLLKSVSMIWLPSAQDLASVSRLLRGDDMFSSGTARVLCTGPRPKSPTRVRFRSRSGATKPAPSYSPASDELAAAKRDLHTGVGIASGKIDGHCCIGGHASWELTELADEA